MDIQEVNGHLIAVAPSGLWAIVNIDGKIISIHDQKEEAVRDAHAQPQCGRN